MKQEIVHTALENLWDTAHIKAKWAPVGPLDGETTFIINANRYTFVTTVKKELREHQLHHIIDHNSKFNNFLIIAEHIFPKIKRQLRELDIAYLETNGNIFLKKDHLYYLIDTNKKATIRKDKANRAFTKTGLKVVFHFLLDKELVNKTHREIAEYTRVGLGNIPQIINGLKETGYLLRLNKKTYTWDHRKELLDRWVNEYATELRPKIIKGTYKLPGNWKKLPLNKEVTVWGGEPAADILTNYLRPEKFILYTKENKTDIIRNYKLLPKVGGELELLDMFWEEHHTEGIAPPLLIYAELILAGGKRNNETAKLIYDEYIQPDL
ncbi:type IV toxin-antitoxin system AbiEi family antitoxin [Sinomicrobium sp.]